VVNVAKDLVCGMQVDEKKSKKSVYRGTTYYFCSPACKMLFDKNPEEYLKG